MPYLPPPPITIDPKRKPVGWALTPLAQSTKIIENWPIKMRKIAGIIKNQTPPTECIVIMLITQIRAEMRAPSPGNIMMNFAAKPKNFANARDRVPRYNSQRNPRNSRPVLNLRKLVSQRCLRFVFPIRCRPTTSVPFWR